MTANYPVVNDIGYPTRLHIAADMGPARNINDICWYIVHNTQGGKFGDEYSLTANDSNISSCHALIWPEGDTITMVPLLRTAWTPGNDYYAERSVNVEMTGYWTERRTEAQYRALAAHYRWCVAQGCNIPAVYIGKSGAPRGILGHQDVPNPYGAGFGGVSGHGDPGPLFDWEKFINLCKGGEITMFDPNPLKRSVGTGVYDAARKHGLTILTNEQYYVPEGNPVGLTKRSFTWAEDRSDGNHIYIILAIQDQVNNTPVDSWSTQIMDPRPS